MRSKIRENASGCSTHSLKLSCCWSWLLRNCIKFLIISCNLYLKQLFADHIQGEFKETAFCRRGKRDCCQCLCIYVYLYISYKKYTEFLGLSWYFPYLLFCYGVWVKFPWFTQVFKSWLYGCSLFGQRMLRCIGRTMWLWRVNNNINDAHLSFSPYIFFFSLREKPVLKDRKQVWEIRFVWFACSAMD